MSDTNDPFGETQPPHHAGGPGDGQPVVHSAVPIPGTVFAGRFMVKEKLGDGGMGEVWLVFDQQLERLAALKLIQRRDSTNPTALARFRREAIAGAAIQHPNAVVVYDAQDKDPSFIVMEHVKGRNVHQVLKDGPLSPDKTAAILEQICDLLHVFHAEGIIHRDLKPSNVMLSANRGGAEVVKVLDFGLAKLLRDDGGDGHFRTRPGYSAGGTVPYASPEQWTGQADADQRSDLYSLGVMLYEMLTGKLPFQGTTFNELRKQTIEDDPPSFQAIAPDVHVLPAVEAVVLRCLEKRPGDRPESARALADEFRAALRSPGMPPPPPPASTSLHLSLACFFALVLPVIVWSCWGRPESPSTGNPDAALRVDVRRPEAKSKGTTRLILNRNGESLSLGLVELPLDEKEIGKPYKMTLDHRDFSMEVKPFALSCTEVTMAQYRMVMGGDLPAERKDWDHPVTGVTWDNAAEYCARLNAALEDRAIEVRLPWEIEWEYAATQGTGSLAKPLDDDGHRKAMGTQGPGSNDREVANRWGFTGLADHVSEWLQDDHVSDPAKRYFAQKDGHIPNGKSENRVIGETVSVYVGASKTASNPSRGFRIVVRFPGGPS